MTSYGIDAADGTNIAANLDYAKDCYKWSKRYAQVLANQRKERVWLYLEDSTAPAEPIDPTE